MNIKFNPNNAVIKLCMNWMRLEDSENIEDAIKVFHKAWHEATDDYERFIEAYHLARQQKSIKDKLKWMETSLTCALKINDDNVNENDPNVTDKKFPGNLKVFIAHKNL